MTCVDACKKERAFCTDSILASIELYHAFDEGGLTCKSIANITEKTTGAPFYRFLFQKCRQNLTFIPHGLIIIRNIDRNM